jgi:putative aldouronate transport system substrate-binding protein
MIDATIQPGQFAITNKCEDPVVAFMWGDSFFNLEATLADKGVEGLHWARVDPSEHLVGINGKSAKYKYVKSLSLDDNAQIGFGPGWTRDIKNEFAASASKFSYEEFLYDATKLYEPYKVRRYPYSTAPISESDMAEFNDLRRTIHTYIGESVDRFIIGDLDVGGDWDKYVRQLYQIGLERYLQILSAAYEAYSK